MFFQQVLTLGISDLTHVGKVGREEADALGLELLVIDPQRIKLDELHVSQLQSCTIGHRITVTGVSRVVVCLGINSTCTSGRQNYALAFDKDRLLRLRIKAQDPGHPPLIDYEIHRLEAGLGSDRQGIGPIPQSPG